MDTEKLLLKLRDAMNQHDLKQFLACFSPDYTSEQPAHPERSFSGRAQVEKNWSVIFNEVPDFSASLIRYSIADQQLWAEWDWQGSRLDGSKLHLRGVTLFGLEQNQFQWGRLYMEPVEEQGENIDDAMRKAVRGQKETDTEDEVQS